LRERRALARDGYALVKCELAVFQAGGVKEKGQHQRNTMGAAQVLSLLVAGTASRGKDFRATACIENSLPSAWFHPLLRRLWITQPRKEKAPTLSMTGASSGAVQAGGLRKKKGNTHAQVSPFVPDRLLGQDSSALPPHARCNVGGVINERMPAEAGFRIRAFQFPPKG